MSLTTTKPLPRILAEAEASDRTLHRTLGPGGLIALGIGAVIGAGIFTLTGIAAATMAGPAIVLSFVLAAIGCCFAALCYSEFATMIPVAGSAYTYAYATLGELVAWIIGWDLVLEYAVGAATVSIGWSQTLIALLHSLGFDFPRALAAGPFEPVRLATGESIRGIVNLPAVFAICAVSLLLMRGIKESAAVTQVLVVLKVAVLLVFVAIGWGYMKPANHTPFLPPNEGAFGAFGWSGVLSGAGVIFFAYIGFDAVSTAAQETRNPKRDMPVGIIGSLIACTALFILYAFVLTGIVSYRELNVAAPLALALDRIPYAWLNLLMNLAVLAGLTSVMLVMLFGQSRVFFSMARDGLLPPVFARVHPRFRTPAVSNLLLMAFVAIFSGLAPISVVGKMTSIGTLFAFVLVCGAILVMRRTHPEAARPFRTPLVPVVPLLGIAANLFLMLGLGVDNWLRLVIWLAIGLAVYFGYGRRHSNVGGAI